MDHLPYKINNALSYYSNSSADNLNWLFFSAFIEFIIHILQKSLSYLCQSKFLEPK